MKNKKGDMIVIGLISVIIVVIILGGLGFYYFVFMSDEDSEALSNEVSGKQSEISVKIFKGEYPTETGDYYFFKKDDTEMEFCDDFFPDENDISNFVKICFTTMRYFYTKKEWESENKELPNEFIIVSRISVKNDFESYKKSYNWQIEEVYESFVDNIYSSGVNIFWFADDNYRFDIAHGSFDLDTSEIQVLPIDVDNPVVQSFLKKYPAIE